MSSPDVLTFVLPPVVGAGIGLFTNWLAIKMLFRPLAEKRLLGLRVPFTPGILPRERARIARSLGDTVALDLLDEGTILARLRSPSFKGALRQAALDMADSALMSNPSDLASGIDSGLSSLVREASAEALSSMAASRTFSASVVAGSEAAIESAGTIPLSALAGRSVLSGLASSLSGPDAADRTSRAVASGIMTALVKAAEGGKRVSAFVDPELLRSMSSSIIESAYPSMLGMVTGVLSDKAVVSLMEKAGARIIRRTLDRFNTVQRFFIGLGQYDKAILENMPATIADFSEALASILAEASTKKAISSRVAIAVAQAAERPLSSLPFLADRAAADKARDGLAAALRKTVTGLDADDLAEALGSLMDGVTIGAALAAFPGLSARLGEAIARWASGLLSGVGRGSDGALEAEDKSREAEVGAQAVAMAFFAAFSRSFKEAASGVPLGETLAIERRTLEDLAARASDGLAELAARESSKLLRSLDIRALVVEKIDGLDMIEVERMLLRVIDKELGAITIFGGILGALIGVFQSLLFLLR